jgi:hypothetical protein
MPASEVFPSGLPIDFSLLSFLRCSLRGVEETLCHHLLAQLLSAKDTWLRIDGSMQKLVRERAFRLKI